MSNTQCAGIGSGQVLSMCVIAVKLQHKGSNKEIITFAMLDTCSQGTFATENLMNQLDINDIQTSFGIGTLIGHKSSHPFYWMVYLFQSWYKETVKKQGGSDFHQPSQEKKSL